MWSMFPAVVFTGLLRMAEEDTGNRRKRFSIEDIMKQNQ